MSARLADCASIFQLAFGLNIIPAAFAGFTDFRKRIHAEVTLAAEDQPQDERSLRYRDQVVADLERRLFKRHQRVFGIVKTLIFLTVSVSIAGLIGAAEHPDTKIRDFYLDAFTVTGIIISPLLCSFWVRACATATNEIRTAFAADDIPARVGLLIRAREAGLSIEDVIRSLPTRERLKVFWLMQKNIGIIDAAKSVFKRPRHRHAGAQKGAKNLHIS